MANKLVLCGVGLWVVASLFTGCANTYRAPFKPPSGAFVTTQTLPLTLEPPAEGLPIANLRKVRSESGYLFWPYPMFDLAWGDLRTLGKLPRGGRLERIAYAEVEVFTVFSLFGRYTVNVYGPGAAE